MAGADGHLGNRAVSERTTDAGVRTSISARVRLVPADEPSVETPAARLSPDLSCEAGLAPRQRRWLVMLASAWALALLVAPLPGLAVSFGLLWSVFTILITWRLGLLVIGLALRLWPRRKRHFPPNELPVYSIMVAVYDEAPVMAQLATALSQIVWPGHKLDIQILLEADDQDTLQAALAAGFPAGTRLTVVPPGRVRTKANALNYGLGRARGDFICIYDAEDRPHPGQLLEAYRAFQAHKGNVACAQAPLVGDNDRDSLVAAHWSLEYATQFGLLVPAMAALRLPIPIGGTSNHFRTDILRGLGGWDAFNVTEDADLGLRLSRFGRRVVMLNLPTFEDAPTTLPVWTAQRSRWIKGFVQTWFVLMRDPVTLARQLGAVRFLTVQMALGGAVLAPVFHAPMMALVLVAVFSQAFSIGTVGTGLLGAGLVVGLLGDVAAPAPWHGTRMLAVLTRVAYWPLHSVAAIKAFRELVSAPHFWAKTPHVPHGEPPH